METAIVSIRNLVDEAANRLEEHIRAKTAADSELRKKFFRWINKQGIGRTRDAIKICARQASYNIVLKTILYELLHLSYPLRELKGESLSGFADLFEDAYTRSKMDVMSKSFLDELIVDCDKDICSLLKNVAALIEKIRDSRFDAVGRIYEESIPPEERRKLGEFYTPRPVAELMARWSIQNKDCIVLDPAVGSGTFLIESFYRLVELGADPSTAPRNLYGFDINPLATLMSTVNIMLRNPKSKPSIITADFFDISPPTNFWRPKSKFPLFDVILCNPPYSRHHELDPVYKERISRMISLEAKVRISRLSSLYLHFFIHAGQFLKPGGRMAFITSSEFLEVTYGEALKKFLLENFDIKGVILFKEENLVFPKILTTACITLLEKSKNLENVAKFVKADYWPGIRELIQAVDDPSAVGRTEWGYIAAVPQRTLIAKNKWTQIFSRARLEHPDFIVPLSALASVKRGIATGANRFFTLTGEEAKRFGIEDHFLRPVLASAKDAPGYRFTTKDHEDLVRLGRKTWLFNCNLSRTELQGTNALKYIEKGEKQKLQERYLTRHRKPWYGTEKRVPPPILFTYMSRKQPRFIDNQARVFALNVFHFIYPKERIIKDERKLKALLAYLNSGIAKTQLRNVGRMYAGGLIKVEPKELENLPVLNVHNIPKSLLNKLSSLFERLCEATESNLIENVQKDIDIQLKELLGV